MQASGRPKQISRRQAIATLAVAVVVHQSGFATLGMQTRVDSAILVRGEANLAGDEMAWRVVHDVAEASNEANFERRALGFTVNTGLFTDLLVTDEATGSAYRLAPNEAAFVSEGTMQRRESLGRDAEQYLRIALVPVDHAEDAGGDRLGYASQAFAAPAGSVTLSLERLELRAGDRAHAGTGVGQTLILVLQGEVEIEEGEDGPVTQLQTMVGSGISYAARSTPWVTSIVALRNGTFVLLASIQ